MWHVCPLQTQSSLKNYDLLSGRPLDPSQSTLNCTVWLLAHYLYQSLTQAGGNVLVFPSNQSAEKFLHLQYWELQCRVNEASEQGPLSLRLLKNHQSIKPQYPPIYYPLFQRRSSRSDWIQRFHHPIQVPSLAVMAQCDFRAIVKKIITICLNHSTTSFTSNFDWYDSKTHLRFSSSSRIPGPSLIKRSNTNFTWLPLLFGVHISRSKILISLPCISRIWSIIRYSFSQGLGALRCGDLLHIQTVGT